MSTVSSVSGPAGTSQDSTTPTALPQQQLGQSDFMKLLAVQFQEQDPMKPMDDTSFIAQMAQFSALQQTNTMNTTLTSMQSGQDQAIANSYLGHRVTVDAGNGATASGDVSGVRMVNGAPELVVGSQTYPLSSVLLVEPGGVSAPATPPTNGGGA